jgi:AAA family ATP:ADP antiporter
MIRWRVVALTSLYLLVVCAVGMLHPVRNALVLGALGGSGFYKVYLASALVTVAVVPFGRLAARIPHRRLTPAVACFFAVNLVLFRALYPGGRTFGVLFYAWHDIYAGILISQFFLATSAFLDPRSAKSMYPMIVAAGAIGAAIGGAVTGFLAPDIGAANLLLIAAALTMVFAVALPFVTGASARAVPSGMRVRDEPERAPLRDVVANRQVQLIAATVLLTVLVKQLVDYQFNAATATLGDRDAISAYQGKFNAATQWLPLVAAMAIRPALARWGIGAALLMLPAGMIVTNVLVGLRGGLSATAVAKGTETTLRYSAERTGREILYMPVSDAVRARAKPLIDVGLESGLAKASSAGLIFVLLATVGANRLAWPSVGLSIVWFWLALAERRAYVQALAHGLRRPAIGLAALSATLGHRETRAIVRRTLAERDPARLGFVLDLLAQAGPSVVSELAADLSALRVHPDPEVRARVAALDARHALAREEETIAPEAAGDAAAAPPTLALTLWTRNGDARERRMAIRALTERGGADAAAVLLDAAADATLELELRIDALRALRRLCDEEPTIPLDRTVVDDIVTQHLDAAERYAAAAAVLADDHVDRESERLLRRAVAEAWHTRQRSVFDALAVIHDSRVVDGCYRAVTGDDEHARADALELIEEFASRRAVQRLEPILRPTPEPVTLGVAGLRRDVLTSLRYDEDAWIAQCAVAVITTTEGGKPMEAIERVFALQRVDVFADTPSRYLARIALLAREVDADTGAVLLRGSEAADAMYVVLDGELRAEHHHRGMRPIMPGESVGSLAVFDDGPARVDVRATRASRLLRLSRRDLRDLLHDHPDLAVSLLLGMATRLRTIVEAPSALTVPGSAQACV